MSAAPSPDETVVACLTPPGAGAIATLALVGPRAWEVVRTLFHPRRHSELPVDPATGRFWLGQFGEGLMDEVVVSVRATNPVPCVEMHCHGGREVIRLLLEILAAHGVKSCTWQELERRTLGDPLRAAAAVAVAEARTVRTAAILLDQYQGALAAALGAIRAAWERGDGDEAGRLLERLAGHAGVGRHLTTPWRVVVAGAPNVGKSSLINALAGYPRCVVAATPGTTRDVVTTLVAVEGWPVELADTAGLHAAGGTLEQQGMDMARAALADADLCLWVLDVSVAPGWPDVDSARVRFVVNKVDLPAAWDLGRADGAVHVSARSGAGLADLCQALAHWLVPEPPPAGAGVPFTAELCAGVEEAWQCHWQGQYTEARRGLERLRGTGG